MGISLSSSEPLWPQFLPQLHERIQIQITTQLYDIELLVQTVNTVSYVLSNL